MRRGGQQSGPICELHHAQRRQKTEAEEDVHNKAASHGSPLRRRQPIALKFWCPDRTVHIGVLRTTALVRGAQNTNITEVRVRYVIFIT